MIRRTAIACAIAAVVALRVSVLPAEEATEPQQAAPAQQVVIRGQKVRPKAPSKDRSVAGSVVEAEELAAPGKTASEVLRGEPGVAIVETGGQGALSTASIRGATSAQTPVYLAGIRLNDDVGGTADLSLVPLWLIHRVEVYRGNAPIEADELGIGGAIFFEPRRPSKPEAAAGAMLGSFGTRGVWGHATSGNEKSSALVGLRIDDAENDYSLLDDRGTRFDETDDIERRQTNADTRTVDLWALGSTELGPDGRVELLVNGVRRERGAPGLSLLPTQRARAEIRRNLMGLSVRVPCDTEGRCQLKTMSAALFAHTAFDDPLRELALAGSRLDVAGRRFEQSASVRWDIANDVTIMPTIRGATERLTVDASGAPALRPGRVFSRSALGVEWRAVRLLTVRALGSGACHGTSETSTTFCDTVEPEGRVGMQLGSSQFSVLTNVGRYARVPTLGELFGFSAAVRGNSDLTPEHGLTADVGLRASAEPSGILRGAYADVFAFVRSADDLIAYRRASLGYVRPFNVGSARVTGLEFLGGVGLYEFLLLELSATLLDPRDTTPTRTTSNDILPHRSRLVLSPRVRVHTRALRAHGLDGLGGEVRYRYQSSRFADSAGLVVIPEQGSLDAEMVLETFDKRLALRFRMVNLLDERHYDVIGFPLPGRAWFGAMEARW